MKILILSIMSVIFTLCLLFVADNVIKGPAQFVPEDIYPSIALPQPVSVESKERVLKQKGTCNLLLNLKLLGTVVGDSDIAYIEDLNSGRQGAYKLGDIISGAEIIDIRLGKVILEKDGQREILVFTKNREEAITRVSATEMAVSRGRILNEIHSDINKVLTMAKVRPHFDFSARKFTGFKIDEIQKDSIFERAGLQNGDIIKMVNRQKLDNPHKAIQIFRKVRKQSQIDIVLLRKNEVMGLSYKIKD